MGTLSSTLLEISFLYCSSCLLSIPVLKIEYNTCVYKQKEMKPKLCTFCNKYSLLQKQITIIIIVNTININININISITVLLLLLRYRWS